MIWQSDQVTSDQIWFHGFTWVFPRLMLSAPISWQMQSEQLLQRHNWIRLVSENVESTFESFKTHVTGINMGSRNLSTSISKTAIRAYYTRAWMVVDSHHRGFVVRNEICMAKSTIKEVMHVDCLCCQNISSVPSYSKLKSTTSFHIIGGKAAFRYTSGDGKSWLDLQCWSIHGLAGWFMWKEGSDVGPKMLRSKITTREKSNCQAVTPFKSFR